MVGLEGEARLVGCGGVWWGVFSSVVYLILFRKAMMTVKSQV